MQRFAGFLALTIVVTAALVGCTQTDSVSIDSILADLRAAGFTLFAMEEDAARRLEDDAGPVEELVALHAAVLPAFNLADGGSRLLLPDALAVQLGG